MYPVQKCPPQRCSGQKCPQKYPPQNPPPQNRPPQKCPPQKYLTQNILLRNILLRYAYQDFQLLEIRLYFFVMAIPKVKYIPNTESSLPRLKKVLYIVKKWAKI